MTNKPVSRYKFTAESTAMYSAIPGLGYGPEGWLWLVRFRFRGFPQLFQTTACTEPPASLQRFCTLSIQEISALFVYDIHFIT